MQEASNTNAANTADCQMARSQQAIIKPKNYKVKNTAWYCSQCDIYCNSKSQFEVHMISIKHSQTLEGKLSGQQEGAVVVEESDAASNHNHLVPESTIDQQTSQSVVYTIEEANCDQAMLDENNNHANEETMAVTTTVLANSVVKRKIDINNFDIADQFKVNARAYLIPESKRIGKFEKFGFYCSKCDAYMTGQIQLVMHIKGAKHQYYSPGELPDYQPSKAYNPNNTVGHYHSRRRSAAAAAAASQHELSHEQMMMKLVAANTVATQFMRMPPPAPQPQPQPLPTFINLPLHPHYHHGSTAASTSYTIQMAQAAAALANQRRAFLKSLAAIGQPPQPQPQPQAHPSYIDYLFKFNEQQQHQSMVQHQQQQESHSHNLPAVAHLYHHHPYPAANMTPPAQSQSADIVSQHYTQQQPSHLYHHSYTNGITTNNGGVANSGFRLVSAITATTTPAATNTSNSMQQVIATANNQSPKQQQQQSQYCFDPNQQQHSPKIDLVKSKPITMINNGNNEAQMSCETCLNDYQNSGVGIMFNQTGGSSQMPYFQAANSNGNNGHCFTYV